MIRILHVINGLAVAGAETMLYKLLSGMDSKRFQSVVVSLSDKGDLGSRIEEAGVPIYALGMKPGRPSPLAALRLYRLTKKFRPHILQTWLYYADLMGLVVGKLAGIPKIFMNLRCTAMDPAQSRFFIRASVYALAWISPLADGMIYNSEAGRMDHEAIGFRPSQWKWIPNGFDLETFRPDPNARARLMKELDIQEPAFLIGHIARFDPQKDHATLISAAKEAVRQNSMIHFVLAGKNVSQTNDDFKNMLRDANCSQNIHLLGKRKDVEKILPGLDALVLSSAFGEGFPNILGEAMACAIPCIATDVGDSKQILGSSGFIVPPKIPKRLAKAMLDLATMNPKEREARGNAARRRIAENFSIEKVVAQYENFYRDALTVK